MVLYALLLSRLVARLRGILRTRLGNMLFDMPGYNLLD